MTEFLEACHHSPALMEQLLTSIHEAVIVTDLDGGILYASHAVEEMTGFRIDELKMEALSILFTPEDLACLYPNLLRMARTNRSFKGEMMLMRKNDVRFFAFVAFRPFFDPAHVENRILICIQDIHKEKRLENALEMTCFEDLVKIANGVAHELRNPLVGIGGFVGRLYEICRSTGEHRRYYDLIITNLRKIENLVKKVEFLSRLPAPILKTESIKDVLEKALNEYVQLFAERRIECSMLLEEARFPLDADLVSRAFSILFENALDALSDEERISIQGGTKNNQYEISVSDTGPGISADDIPYIFDPFFSTKAAGAGIDLSIAKRIMNSHGGSIKVTSKKGEGATFLLHFPFERRRSIRVSLLPDTVEKPS